jgi:hypothetical protein
MNSTAIYPNRQADKQLVEELLGLPEFPGNRCWTFSYRGSVVAQGYRRIVYGDHGPYIEFNPEHITCTLINRFGGMQKMGCYYIWKHPQGHPGLKVYLQLKSVAKLRNAPTRFDGKPSKFNRSEGYADYVPGLLYISAWDIECKETT